MNLEKQEIERILDELFESIDLSTYVANEEVTNRAIAMYSNETLAKNKNKTLRNYISPGFFCMPDYPSKCARKSPSTLKKFQLLFVSITAL